MASLVDLQRLQGLADRRRGAQEPLAVLAGLVREVGAVAGEMAVWHARVHELGGDPAPAWAEREQKLALEMAACLTLLLRLANQAGVNLEEAYQLSLKQ